MTFKPWSFASLLCLRCPVCGKNTFKTGWFSTAPSCGACNTVFEEEDGFYAGAIYPMYGLAAVIGGLGFLGAFLAECVFETCLIASGVVVVLASPWLFWYSRMAFVHTHHRFFKNFDGPKA
ncbi:MAG: hypothetical protein ACREKE_08245 [bacterium]